MKYKVITHLGSAWESTVLHTDHYHIAWRNAVLENNSIILENNDIIWRYTDYYKPKYCDGAIE